MTDCGFNATVGLSFSGDSYYIYIHFPCRITSHDSSQQYTLEIEDSFSDMASPLSRLITAGDTAASSSTTAEESSSGGSGVVTRLGAGRVRGLQGRGRGRGRGQGRKRGTKR
jgi:hypothetical protein